MKKPKYFVFDNEGETFDRYTIIDQQGDMLGLSDDPTHPQGFSQFAGNCVDNKLFVTYGYGWRKTCDVKKITKHELPLIIEEFKRDGNIGKLIEFDKLPENIQKHANKRFEV
jgi:hypothetical protein